MLISLVALLFIERKGKTVHLLKKSSKPITEQRKRLKLNPLGDLDEYRRAQALASQKNEEQKQEETEAQMQQQMLSIDSSKAHGHMSGQVNVIGNVEDSAFNDHS